MQKLLAFFLTFMLSVSLLAGCGSSASKENGAKPAQVTTSANEKNTAAKQVTNVDTNSKANGGKIKISEDKAYTDKEHVAAYINEFAKLPHNYITKNEAKKLGWQTNGTLDKVAPGKSIGGDRYGNYEKKLPDKNGRSWKECDIDYVKGNRNGKRIVFSNDGLIYYTGDHYNSFSKLYGK